MPNIVSRISAHRRKLYSLLPSGMALRHTASPSSCLQVERLYALSVLPSGLGALVLSKCEINALHIHYKNTLRSLLKLPKDVPEASIFFLAGSLPIEGHLHMRVLSLFSMICHLQGNPLNSIARNALFQARPSSRSWFFMLRRICIKYSLPHPLVLLTSPLSRQRVKSPYKSRIREFWHNHLTAKVTALPSLQNMNPQFLSLNRPHPL